MNLDLHYKGTKTCTTKLLSYTTVHQKQRKYGGPVIALTQERTATHCIVINRPAAQSEEEIICLSIVYRISSKPIEGSMYVKYN